MERSWTVVYIVCRKIGIRPYEKLLNTLGTSKN